MTGYSPFFRQTARDPAGQDRLRRDTVRGQVRERAAKRCRQRVLSRVPVRCPAGSRTTLNDRETPSESTSSDTLSVSTRVQAFHGVTEK
jgi:hypothetical protein